MAILILWSTPRKLLLCTWPTPYHEYPCPTCAIHLLASKSSVLMWNPKPQHLTSETEKSQQKQTAIDPVLSKLMSTVIGLHPILSRLSCWAWNHAGIYTCMHMTSRTRMVAAVPNYGEHAWDYVIISWRHNLWATILHFMFAINLK